MKPKKQYKITFEVVIVILIALCMLFLMDFSNEKLDEVIASDREALLMRHDEGNPIHEDLAKQIINFRPDAYKMIEVYSEDFKSLFKVHFNDDTSPDDEPNIQEYDELMDLFKNNVEGHTNITIDDEEEDVYFRWIKDTNDKMCLVLIYMSRPVVKNLWVFSFVCCLILILTFILLIRLLMKQHQEKIRMYQANSQEIQKRILEQ